MNLSELKINFLGDSITQGGCASTDENRYVDLIAAKTGAVCRNYGVGGTRLARQKNKSEKHSEDYLDFCIRMHDMKKDADVIVIFGGTNDYGHGDAPLGASTDTEPDTFYGAVNYLMENLELEYPNAKKIYVTPMHRFNENNLRGEGFKTKDGPILKEYVSIIIEAAKKHNSILLDFYNDLGIDPNKSEDNKKYFADGLHPNDLGHEVIADKIISFISKL